MSRDFPIAFPDPIEPDDLITDVVDAIRRSDLGDQERELAEAVVDRVLARAITGATELIKEIERDGRRLVDEAREDLGLPSIEELEDAKRFRDERRDDAPKGRLAEPRRDEAGRAIQECAAEGCVTISDGKGMMVPVVEKRWHCARHRHLASPDDLSPWKPEPIRLTEAGTFALPQAELDAEARHMDKLLAESKARREKRQRERAEQRGRLDELKRRRFEKVVGEFPPGVLGPPPG